MPDLEIDVEKICCELKIRPEVYRKIVAGFSKSLVEKMKALGDALSVDDADMMRMILHEIKGTAGNLRIHNVSKAETAMHEAVKQGDTKKNIERDFEKLERESECLQQWVYKHCEGKT